jgi:hypothetical protein
MTGSKLGFDLLRDHLGVSQADLALLSRIQSAALAGASTEQIASMVQAAGLTPEDIAELSHSVALVNAAMERARKS